jgi:hypothetical protein
MNPVHIASYYFSKFLILFSHLRLDLPNRLFPFGFPTKILHASLFVPMRATFSANLVLLNFIILVTLCEEYKL